MKAAYESSGYAFSNAREHEVSAHRLEAYPPVDELFAEISSWFASVQGCEDDQPLAEIRIRLARIRGCVVFGLLPFDDLRLRLKEQLEELEVPARQFPSLSSRLERISVLVRYLRDSPSNPKRNKVLALLSDLEESRLPVGIVSPRTRLALPGWGADLRDELCESYRRIQLITSSKRLVSTDFRKLIVPWGGRGCPFLYEVFHTYNSPSIDTFVYRCERLVTPARRQLPKGAPIGLPVSRQPARQPIEVEAEDHGEPDWKRAGFWVALRKTDPDLADPEKVSDKEFLQQARLVLLANESKVFLNEASKVIEVSELVEGGADAKEWKRFPRRPVRDLRAGDLVVLRTSGSGDYLVDVADSLMAKDGKPDLRARALDWKEPLRKALEDLGSHVIANLLESKGHGIQSGHRYIWNWTTSEVIRPRSEGLFYEMLAILHDIGYIEAEALETAESRCALMNEVLGYHYKAANQIRKALLARLRKLVKKGEQIEESLALKLPGVDSGTLSVLRVSAVDPDTVEVPYHKIGTVLSMYE